MVDVPVLVWEPPEGDEVVKVSALTSATNDLALATSAGALLRRVVKKLAKAFAKLDEAWPENGMELLRAKALQRVAVPVRRAAASRRDCARSNALATGGGHS